MMEEGDVGENVKNGKRKRERNKENNTRNCGWAKKRARKKRMIYRRRKQLSWFAFEDCSNIQHSSK